MVKTLLPNSERESKSKLLNLLKRKTEGKTEKGEIEKIEHKDNLKPLKSKVLKELNKKETKKRFKDNQEPQESKVLKEQEPQELIEKEEIEMVKNDDYSNFIKLL